MPELPEVELERRTLARWAVGRRVDRVRVPKSRLLGDKSPASVIRALEHKKVIGTERRGKHALILFDDDRALHFHLGMSGRWVRIHEDDPLPPHARIALTLDDRRVIVLRDARMFGRIDAGHIDELRERFFETLGPDPLQDRFDGKTLLAILARTRRPVKIALMDQSLIAGIGNIYAAEALWLARIHPDQPASTIDRAAANRLAKAIQRSLRATLESVGRGSVSYVQDADSENPFRIYGRAGERCTRCRRSVIEKSEHGGRATYLCSVCQPIV